MQLVCQSYHDTIRCLYFYNVSSYEFFITKKIDILMQYKCNTSELIFFNNLLPSFTFIVLFVSFSLAGMSRSVTVAVAYIMSVTSLNWKEALKVVRAGRSVANPNLGFQRQLQEFESYKLVEVYFDYFNQIDSVKDTSDCVNTIINRALKLGISRGNKHQ